MTDTKPVFDAIVHNTMRLFGTSYAVVALRRGQVFELAGFKGEPGFERLQDAYPLPLDKHTIVGEVVIARQVRKYTPVVDNPAVPCRTAEFARRFGFNSLLAAPMMWKGEAIGAIGTARRQPLPFDDKQVLLIQSFANQAVIAIENARLFKELQERTEALTKSVGQLTALGEVGQAISSTLDLEKVLKTIVQRAVQLAGLDGGAIYEFDERDEGFHLRAAESISSRPSPRSRRSRSRTRGCSTRRTRRSSSRRPQPKFSAPSRARSPIPGRCSTRSSRAASGCLRGIWWASGWSRLTARSSLGPTMGPTTRS
jgi:GAF domain-containing protein